MTTRIYTVSDGVVDHLVRATTRRAAVFHVASKHWKTRVATQDDLLLLLGNGATVENAGEDNDDGK